MRPHWMRSLSIYGAGILAALMLEVAHAVPFHYSESVSGDLDANPTTAYSLGIGNNSVSGSTYFGVAVPHRPHFDADFDSFAFNLPAGSRLVGISLTFTTAFSNTVSAIVDERLCPGVGYCFDGVLGYQTVSFFDAAPLQVDFGGALPLTAGTYTLIADSLGIGPVIDPSRAEWWSTDYIWNLQVIRVPEPGLLPLLGLGLFVLAAVRRSKLVGLGLRLAIERRA